MKCERTIVQSLCDLNFGIVAIEQPPTILPHSSSRMFAKKMADKGSVTVETNPSTVQKYLGTK